MFKAIAAFVAFELMVAVPQVALTLWIRQTFLAVDPSNPEEAIKLVDTVSGKGLIWWLTALVIFGALALYLLVRVIMRNHAQVLSDLRKEKLELAEQQRKDRESAEQKHSKLYDQLLETNRRFVSELSPVIQANTQAQTAGAQALKDLDQSVKVATNQVASEVRNTRETAEETRRIAENTLRATQETQQAVNEARRASDLMRESFTRTPPRRQQS